MNAATQACPAPEDMTREQRQMLLKFTMDLIARQEKNCGRVMWLRMSPEARLVECKAALCDEMIRDLGRTDLQFWTNVSRSLVLNIIPE
jgi:hypothetical protein